MDLYAALFAVGSIYLAYIEFIAVKRLRTDSEGELSRHMRVRYSIQILVHIVAAILFALSSALTETSLLIVGIFAVMIARVISLVFKTVRPRQ